MNFLSLAVRTKRTGKETGIVALPLSQRRIIIWKKEVNQFFQNPPILTGG